MKRTRYRPKLDKQFVATKDGYDVFTIDAFAVRNVAQPDEEFDNFATHNEFADLIPEGEIWISNRSFDAEGDFFIANAIARLNALEEGESADSAYTIGLNADRKLRAARTGIRYRAIGVLGTSPRSFMSESTWFSTMRSSRSRSRSSMGCECAGTSVTDSPRAARLRLPVGAKSEIWVEQALRRAELRYYVAHELHQRRLMRGGGMEYDKAHDAVQKMDSIYADPKRRSFPGLSRRRSANQNSTAGPVLSSSTM